MNHCKSKGVNDKDLGSRSGTWPHRCRDEEHPERNCEKRCDGQDLEETEGEVKP